MQNCIPAYSSLWRQNCWKLHNLCNGTQLWTWTVCDQHTNLVSKTRQCLFSSLDNIKYTIPLWTGTNCIHSSRDNASASHPHPRKTWHPMRLISAARRSARTGIALPFPRCTVSRCASDDRCWPATVWSVPGHRCVSAHTHTEHYFMSSSHSPLH